MTFTKEHKERIKLNHARPWKGKNDDQAPNWRGGLTKNKEYRKIKQTEYLRRVRMSAIEALGAICVTCGFSDIRALQIDHINGGGSKERKERKYNGSFHSHVIKSFLAKEGTYQLLCANCNWIKRVENNERTL